MQKRLLSAVAGILILYAAWGAALAEEVYTHIDVLCAGSAALGDTSVPLELTSISVTAAGRSVDMGAPLGHESADYPIAFHSVDRALRIPAGAKIVLDCTFGYTFNGEEKHAERSFYFTAQRGTCAHEPAGVELRVEGQALAEAIPEAQTLPRAAAPADYLPQTGDAPELWTVIFLLTGLCVVAGVALIIIGRAHKE